MLRPTLALALVTAAASRLLVPLLSSIALAAPAIASLAGASEGRSGGVIHAQAEVQFASPGQSGGEGAGTLTATLVLSAVQGADVTVPFTLSGAATEGDDYSVTPNPVVIPAGSVSADISITVVDDALDELDEQAVLTLGTPSGAILGAQTVHTVTLLDDDATPEVRFDLPQQKASENAGVVPVAVSLSAPSGLDVTVPFVVKGDASLGVDYQIDASPLVIPAGQAGAAISITVLDDLQDEARREYVRLRLKTPTNAILGAQSRLRFSIVDDDGPGQDYRISGLSTDVSFHDFGFAHIGDTSELLTITLSNTHAVDITFNGLELSGPDSGEFQVSYDDPLPVLLTPGASTLLHLGFAPLDQGTSQVVAKVLQTPHGAPETYMGFSGLGIGAVGEEVLMNASDQPYLDTLGREWCAEYGLYGVSEHDTTFKTIAGTEDDPLYQGVRQGSAFGYSLPLPAGEYEVTVHGCEFVWAAPHKRVFDVHLEGVPRLVGVDIFDQVGHAFAWQGDPLRVTLSDGVLDVGFTSIVDLAALAALEVRAVPSIEADLDLIDFGVVDQGFVAEQVLTLTNSGTLGGTLTEIGFVMGTTSEGSGADFYVRIDGLDYYGSGSTVFHTVNLDLPAGQSVPLSIFFEPSVHAENALQLSMDGDFPLIWVDMRGTGGADPDWGFLHPVPDTDRELVVDFNRDGFELLGFSAYESHTHEPGKSIVGYQWTVDGAPASTADNFVHSLTNGAHLVSLTIFDDNLPAQDATDDFAVEVHKITDVPGILTHYYDGSSGGAQALLDAVPSSPQHSERLGAFDVRANGLLIGSSGLSSEAMVQWQAKFLVSATASYEFLPSGGYDHRLFVDDQAVSGPIQLLPGDHKIEVRFAVADVSDLPLLLSVLVDGVEQPTFADGIVHDERQVLPLIHSMPTVGAETGGNLITMDGFGYFPLEDVTVHWGNLADLTAVDFLSWTDDRITLSSPPGTGVITVTVETPNGTSNGVDFFYSPDGPVPIKFNLLGDREVSLPGPTTGFFHPNGKLYVGLYDGRIAELSFDENWFLEAPGVVIHQGVTDRTNDDLLGLTYNPYDDPNGPVTLYVGHGEHWLNGGGSFSGPSPFTGQISVLTGPDFDTPVVLVDRLPTSNHDHGINGLTFDNNGDLLFCLGGNTNAGVKWPQMGDLDESPLTGALVKAETSRPDFNGSVVYLDRSTGQPVLDQSMAENSDVAPGVHVFSYAHGLRNPYDYVQTSWGLGYSTDNGPNFGYGYASTGPDTDTNSHVGSEDELMLVEEDGYYGHPNRSRGYHDPRQYVYRAPGSSSSADFSDQLQELESSTDGIDEYRSGTFGGQLRGRLLVQKWSSSQTFLTLDAERRSVVETLEVSPTAKGLDAVVGCGGTIVTLDYSSSKVRFLEPDDAAAAGLTAYEISPWRAPSGGGTPFVIGGEGFINGQTTVTIGGTSATLNSVSPRRIKGVLPALAENNIGSLYDVQVSVGLDAVTIEQAFLAMPAQPGGMPGFWHGTGSMPVPLGEVASAVVGSKLYLFGQGSSATYARDMLSGSWASGLAPRPFTGNHHALEVWGGKVYLFGGLDSGSPGKVQIYDPASDSWTQGVDMPWSGGSCSSALIGDQVYVCGGIVGSTTVNNLSVYDLASNTWDLGGVNLATMPVAVNHAASGSDGTRLWVFGGRAGGNFPQDGFDTVQVYDPLIDSWDVSSAPGSVLAALPAGRGGTGRAVYHHGEFYVFGGESASDVFDDVFVYSVSEGTWKTEASMPTARHGMFPAVFKSRIYLAGGGTSAGFSSSDVVEVFQRN